MASKSKGLGRSLGALLGELSEAEAQQEPVLLKMEGAPVDAVVSLRLSDIDPNREQPRRSFDEQAMQELTDSIRAMGVIQPILVSKNGRRYTIIAGERRWRAARFAGLTEIPAIIRDWDEVKRMEAALVENLQRDDLNPVEEAMGVKRLMEQCGLTQDKVAERLGKSRPAVANTLRLLTLPEAVLNMIREGKLSAGHGRALVPLSRDMQVKLAQLAAAQGWSVRQLEKICRQQLEKKDEPKPEPKPVDPEYKHLERMARDVFGARVELSGDENKGKLVVHYRSADDLQRIYDIMDHLSNHPIA